MEMLNDGILSIDETEGEEISLTAELPSDQFTDEEKLQIESEKEDGDDEVKRIDLFASENKEGDPLNNLLLGEDGITTLFMKKGGRVPFRGGGADASSDDFGGGFAGQGSGASGPAGGASSGGNYGGNQNTGGGDNNQGSDKDHSRFDVGSGYYGEEVTDRGESGDTKTETVETFYDDEITRKDPIERIKTNVVDRRDKYNKAKNLHALKQVKNVFTGNILGTLYGEYKFKKDVVDPYVNDLKKDIEKYKELGIPEYSPHTDTLIQELEQEILDITQPKSRDKDEFEPDGSPAIQEIMVAKETIEDRDETDIFNIWDKIKAKQAQRALLVEKGIIQDNAEMPQTKEAMMLNSGGLANLFRVKTQ
jgi:hypothetical protein